MNRGNPATVFFQLEGLFPSDRASIGATQSSTLSARTSSVSLDHPLEERPVELLVSSDSGLTGQLHHEQLLLELAHVDAFSLSFRSPNLSLHPTVVSVVFGLIASHNFFQCSCCNPAVHRSDIFSVDLVHSFPVVCWQTAKGRVA
jgi:hypothetical protein